MKTWVSNDGMHWMHTPNQSGAKEYCRWAQFSWGNEVLVVVRRFSPPEGPLTPSDLARRLYGDGTTPQPGPDEEPTGS